MDDLRERVEAVERAVTDGDGDLTALAEGAATAERVRSLEDDVAALRDDVAELEAATRALRGYVGNVRSVNERVEQRADAATAAVDRLEARLDERDAPPGADGSAHSPDDGTTPAPASRDPTMDRESVGEQRASGANGHGTDACPACGRHPGDREGATADGRGSTAPAGIRPDGAGEQADDARADPVAGPDRDDLAGFDPDGAPERVRVRPAGRDEAGRRRTDAGGGAVRSGTDGDGAGGGAAAGLVDRVRELL